MHSASTTAFNLGTLHHVVAPLLRWGLPCGRLSHLAPWPRLTTVGRRSSQKALRKLVGRRRSSSIMYTTATMCQKLFREWQRLSDVQRFVLQPKRMFCLLTRMATGRHISVDPGLRRTWQTFIAGLEPNCSCSPVVSSGLPTTVVRCCMLDKLG